MESIVGNLCADAECTASQPFPEEGLNGAGSEPEFCMAKCLALKSWLAQFHYCALRWEPSINWSLTWKWKGSDDASIHGNDGKKGREQNMILLTPQKSPEFSLVHLLWGLPAWGDWFCSTELSRAGYICARLTPCGAPLRMDEITASSPAPGLILQPFFPPKGFLWNRWLWQTWSCHPVVLAMRKLSVSWNPPEDLGWCQTIMYSFCSNTLKVQLILTISLPIHNVEWGDFPHLCMLWQAELRTEAFQSLILWFKAIPQELGWSLSQAPHLHQCQFSQPPIPSPWMLFSPRQPQAFWARFWEI